MTLLMMGETNPETPPVEPPEELPTTLRNKTWITNNIKRKAPSGRQTYSWWLDYFQTVLKDNWDIN